MKKINLIWICMILLVVPLVMSIQDNKVIGYKDTYKQIKTHYETDVSREIIDFEHEIVTKNQKYTDCYYLNNTINNTINKNKYCDIKYKTVKEKVINYDKPIYKEKVINIKSMFKNYVFDTKKCFICGKYVACLSNLDGGNSIYNRKEKFKCDKNNYPILRSGESGFIENLKTGKTNKLQNKNNIKI